jgi:hypothetical protein
VRAPAATVREHGGRSDAPCLPEMIFENRSNPIQAGEFNAKTPQPKERGIHSASSEPALKHAE